MRSRTLLLGGPAVAGLLAAVIAANYVTVRYGFIPVGFGLEATAGTIFAGVALALRDAIQDLAGKATVVAVIATAGVVSYLIASPAIALASAAAFMVSELADLAAYTPLRHRAKFGDRRWAIAVLVSGVVGAVIDTAVFLAIAFGLAAVGPAFAGQLIGKTAAAVLFVIAGKAVASGPLLRQPDQQPESA